MNDECQIMNNECKVMNNEIMSNECWIINNENLTNVSAALADGDTALSSCLTWRGRLKVSAIFSDPSATSKSNWNVRLD